MTDADTEPRKRQKTDLLLDDCFGVYTDGVSPAAPSHRMDFIVCLNFKEFRMGLKGPSAVTYTFPELVDRATCTFLGTDNVVLELEQPPVILCVDEAFAKKAFHDAAKTQKAVRHAVQELWLKDAKDRALPVIRRLIADAFRVPGTLVPHCTNSVLARVGINLKVWATPEVTDLVAAKKAVVIKEKCMKAVRPLLDPLTIAVISTVDSDDDSDYDYDSDSDTDYDMRFLKYAPEGTQRYELRAKVKAFGTHLLDSEGEIMGNSIRVNPHDILLFEIWDAPAEFKALGIDDVVCAAFKSQDGEMRAYRQKHNDYGHFLDNYKETAYGRTGRGKCTFLLKVYVPGDVEKRKAAQVSGRAAGAAAVVEA